MLKTAPSVTAVAKALGISRKTASRLVLDGLKKHPNGGYSLAEARSLLALRAERAKSATSPHSLEAKKWDARYRKARALAAEHELQVATGQMIPKSMVIQRELAIKGAFKRLPRSIAPRLVGKGAREIEALLTERMFDIFRFLAGQDPT